MGAVASFEQRVQSDMAAARISPLPMQPSAVDAQTTFAPRMQSVQSEWFAFYNRHEGVCLDGSGDKLAVRSCNLSQALTIDSPFSFHWKPSSDNNLSYLAVILNGAEMCARHSWRGTHFYPCDSQSTPYSLGKIDKNGQLQIHDASRSDSCIRSEFKSKAIMGPCGKVFKNANWEKIHIAYLAA